MNPTPNRLSIAEFASLAALLFSLVALSIDAMLPAMGEIANDLGVADRNDAQLVIGVFFLGNAFGQPLPNWIGKIEQGVSDFVSVPSSPLKTSWFLLVMTLVVGGAAFLLSWLLASLWMSRPMPSEGGCLLPLLRCCPLLVNLVGDHHCVLLVLAAVRGGHRETAAVVLHILLAHPQLSEVVLFQGLLP